MSTTLHTNSTNSTNSGCGEREAHKIWSMVIPEKAAPVTRTALASLGMEMNRLTRDGTAEPVSRDQVLRRERGQGNIVFIFPVQLTTSRIGNLIRLIGTLAIWVTIHTGPVTADSRQ